MAPLSKFKSLIMWRTIRRRGTCLFPKHAWYIIRQFVFQGQFSMSTRDNALKEFLRIRFLPTNNVWLLYVVRLPRGLRDGRVTSGRLDSPRDGRVTSGGLDSLRDGRVTSVGLDSPRDGRFTSGGLDSLRDGRVTSVGVDSPRDGRFTSVGLDSPRDGRVTSVGLDSPRDGRFTSVGLDSLRDGRVTLFKLRAYGQSRCHFPVVTSNLVYLSGVSDARSIGYHWPLNGLCVL